MWGEEARPFVRIRAVSFLRCFESLCWFRDRKDIRPIKTCAILGTMGGIIRRMGRHDHLERAGGDGGVGVRTLYNFLSIYSHFFSRPLRTNV